MKLIAVVMLGALGALPLFKSARVARPEEVVAAADTGFMRLTPAAVGNEARYRVREQLAGVDFPSDAVGRTMGITGAIVLDRSGHLVAGASKLVIDVTQLKSDRERRDRYVQGRILQTDRFPNVELVPTGVRGLPWPLPPSATFDFDLMADLTVHGTTRPTTWRVTAKTADGMISGTATTTTSFDELDLEKPRVAVVLTVENEIQLEYDFRFVIDTTGAVH